MASLKKTFKASNTKDQQTLAKANWLFLKYLQHFQPACYERTTQKAIQLKAPISLKLSPDDELDNCTIMAKILGQNFVFAMD